MRPSRYKILRRSLGCGPLTAGFIALMNWARGYPPNELHFLNVVIEIKDTP